MEKLLLLMILVVSHGATAQANLCEPIILTTCQGLGYNMTSYPNSFGHVSQQQAYNHLEPYLQLLDLQCSTYSKEFLCFLYAPVCTILDVVLPCRSLCQSVRHDCLPTMKENGMSWPDEWNCKTFPKGDALCVDSTVAPTTTAPMTAALTAAAPPTAAPTTTTAKQECQPIAEESVCSSIGYTMTHMPNSLGHQNQDDAHLELNTFHPLVQIGCSAELQLFLCSLYLPKCTPSQTLPPCRQLCNKVRDGCSDLMLRFGHAWPDYMLCENFPDSNNSSVCVGVPSSAVIPIDAPSATVIPTSQAPMEFSNNYFASIIDQTQRVVAFEARYKLSCDDVQKDKDWGQLVNSTAQANTAHLIDVCEYDCSINDVPDVGCRKGRLRIRWYTDMVYPSGTRRIDSAVKSKLRKRIKCKKSMLMTVSNPQPLQFLFPILNNDGASAKVILV